jgi:hypothetical protein
LLGRHGIALISFVPEELDQSYKEGRVLLLDNFDIYHPKIF